MVNYLKAKLQIVEVTWMDPHSPEATAQYNINELDNVHSPLKIKTIGILLRNDEIGITTACEDCGEGNYRGLTFIIRSLIQNVTVLATQRKPRKPKTQETNINGKSIPGRTEGQLSGQQANISPTTVSIPSDNG